MAPVILSRADGYSGVSAGIRFSDGKAETSDEAALAYFARHDYTIVTEEPVAVITPATPPAVSTPDSATETADGNGTPPPADDETTFTDGSEAGGSTAEPKPRPPEVGAGSGGGEWKAYAASLEPPIVLGEDAKRGEYIAAVQAREAESGS